MTVGTLLLRPERVRARVDAPTFTALGSDLVAVVTAMATDAGRAEPRIPPVAEAAFAALGERLAARMGDGLEAAGERIGRIVDPLLQAILAPLEQAAGDPAAIFAALGDLVVDATDAAAGLDLDGVEEALGTFVTALTVDLELSFEALRDELLVTIDDVSTALADDEPTFAAALRRLRRRAAATPLPALDFGALARHVLDDLRRRGLERAAELVRCVAGNVAESVDAAGTLATAVPFTGFGTHSVGGAAGTATPRERHAWYATWLLGYKRPLGTQIGLTFAPWEGADEVWVADGQVTRRNKWRDDQPLGPGDDWTDALIFSAATELTELRKHGLEGHYTFGRVDAATMEAVALWSAVSASGVEAVAHLYSLESGDYAVNIGQILTNTAGALTAGIGQRPLPWWLDHLGLRTLYPLVASLEGTHSRVAPGNWLAFWLTLVGPDLGEVLITHLGVHALRDLALSVLTLANHRGASGDAPKPQNRLEVDGVAAVFTWLTGKLAMAVIPRSQYNLLFTDGGNTANLLVLHNLLVTPIFAILGYVAGWLVARLIAGEARDPSGIGAGIGKSAFVAWVTFVPSLYLAKEGDTAGGTFNPDGPDFDGYPDPDGSPYRLPWTAGVRTYVGQANQGFFSHHTLTGEVYAYDFGLDEDEPVLAARPGTIVAFAEGFDDGNTADPNFIRIRHDVDDAGNPIAPDPDHDKDGGGAVVRTYASYLHGRRNSVTAAFGGATPAVGDTVTQGQPIMLAGDTGKSFHNHLHLEVHPDDGGGNPATARTIPFVFADVRHDWRSLGTRDQGVPYHFDFYTAGG